MPKRKKSSSSAKKKKQSDQSLMFLAAAAALIVGFFSIIAYKSNNTVMLPTPTPNQIMTVSLDTENKSGESGMATLQEVDGKVIVTLSLTGFATGITQPAHIHVGGCPGVGAIKFPLASVVNGQSVTTIDTTLAALKATEPLAINVHKSVASSSVYYSCGNINL